MPFNQAPNAYDEYGQPLGNLGPPTAAPPSPPAPQSGYKAPNGTPQYTGPIYGPGAKTAPQQPTQSTPTPTGDPFGSQFAPDSGRHSEDYWSSVGSTLNQRPGADFLDKSNAFRTMSTPGQFEQHVQQNAGSFGAPGAGQQYWEGLNGSQNQFTGGFTGPNNAQSAFQQLNENVPGSIQGTFDKSYDRALDKGLSRFNTEAASRGNYGSSAALSGVGGVISDIEAQRANRASDFALQDSANQRAWHDSAAGAARNADITGLDAFSTGANAATQFGNLALNVGQEELDRQKFQTGAISDAQAAEQARIKSGADLAFGESQENLANVVAGGNLANLADQSYRARSSQAFDNQLQASQAAFQSMYPQLQGIVGNDQATQEDIWRAIMAQSGQTYQMDQNDRRAGEESIKQGVDLLSAASGVGA